MAYVTTDDYTGFFKNKYARRVVNTVPQDLVLQRDTKFNSAARIGKQYVQAVITQLEQGGTYSRGGQGAFSLNTPIAGSIEEAVVDGSQFVLIGGIDYETLAKAQEEGELAHGSSGDMLLKNMSLSARKRLEIDLWMGQSSLGLGIVLSVATNTITFTDATWCPGYWIGMEDAVCEVFATGLGTNRGTASVVSVDVPNKAVTFTTLPTGTVATDVIFFKDQREAAAWNSLLGLLAMAGTSSGNLFGISTAKSVWTPTQYNVAGALSFTKLNDAIITAAYKGMVGGATAYIPVSRFNALLTEQAALRTYGGEFSGRVELVNGGESIKFHTMIGPLIIKPVIYLQDGYGVICQSRTLTRTGATDVTFEIPGMKHPLMTVGGSVAGVTFQCYYNQALFCPEPGKLVQLYGITD